jgi:tetratricopeptide (TPR) repeat protein
VNAGQPNEHPANEAPTPTALFQAGAQHMQAGRPLDAQLCCRQALAIAPTHIDSLHLMGLIALQARQFDHAIEWIARANQQDANADYLFSLGTALTQQGLLQEACKAFDRAVQLKPGDVEAWASRAGLAAKLEQPAEALRCYQRLGELDPRDADAAFQCGYLLLTFDRPAEALICLDRCDALMPDHARVLEQRAIALHHLRRFEESIDVNRRAHALKPDNADICNNLGASLQYLRQDEEALAWFDKALALRPHFIKALINRASSLGQMRRIVEAIAVYRQIQAIDPGNTEAESYLSLLYRLIGDFEASWAGQKARWNEQARRGDQPQFHQSALQGPDGIVGKTIIVYADEGLGDTIQFARYIPMLAARGAEVVLVAQPPLLPLLSGLPGVRQCLPQPATALPRFDWHCPIGNLPIAFGTRLDTIPAAEAYLPAPPTERVQCWEQRLTEHLGSRSKLRVGLTWSGNPRHSNDHNRSISLRLLQPLLGCDADFISLQKEPRAGDRAELASSRILDLTAHLTDFTETLALVDCLDLVISVDTSIVHLAAAAGRPTWILLPYMPDYRWLLDRDDNPWYPTARLFRQGATRAWEDVVENVRRALDEKIAARSA